MSLEIQIYRYDCFTYALMSRMEDVFSAHGLDIHDYWGDDPEKFLEEISSGIKVYLNQTTASNQIGTDDINEIFAYLGVDYSHYEEVNFRDARKGYIPNCGGGVRGYITDDRFLSEQDLAGTYLGIYHQGSFFEEGKGTTTLATLNHLGFVVEDNLVRHKLDEHVVVEGSITDFVLSYSNALLAMVAYKPYPEEFIVGEIPEGTELAFEHVDFTMPLVPKQ